jgi:hypothetical protein
MAYPTLAELKTFLYGAGLVASPPAGASATWAWDKAISAGIRRVESETKRVFLQPAAFSKEFDAPTGRDRRLFTGDHTSVTSITYLGQTIAATEYLSGPLNAADASPVALPYQYIEFYREWWAPTPWAQRAQLVVTATWGFSAAVPDDVFNAMLIAGGLALWPQISTNLSRGGLTSGKLGDAAVSWGDKPLRGIKEDWEEEVRRVCDAYRDWSASFS